MDAKLEVILEILDIIQFEALIMPPAFQNAEYQKTHETVTFQLFYTNVKRDLFH
jgi:hypothetical protein